MKVCSGCGITKDRFHKDKRSKDGYVSQCVECVSTNYKHRHEVEVERRATSCKHYCVYGAIYLDGLYIGEGLEHERRLQHLSGNTGVGRKLNQKANEFHIIFEGTKGECKIVEKSIIEHYDIRHLLNEVVPPCTDEPTIQLLDKISEILT